MGELNVRAATNPDELKVFVRQLLAEVRALEKMIDLGWFEIDTIRIGAEQEMCLIDKYLKPAMKALPILQKAEDHPLFTSELLQFNLEVNMDPLEFKGKCFSKMEKALRKTLDEVRVLANSEDCELILAGILPTIRKSDVQMESLTPFERYKVLMSAITAIRGTDYELKIDGIDELSIKQDSPLLEGCNTGFQIHLQIKPDEFVGMYNIAQAITGPTLALATNSPILFGKRLWHESRIALFQQSIDVRKSSSHLRDSHARVTFGTDWIHNSVADIYKEDIARYRVLLHTELSDDPFETIAKGEIPDLKALTVHNSTVYRWNRPCYGIGGGKPHLRIENRILPAGPTVLDEIATAMFWLGLMQGMFLEYPDVRQLMDFDDAKTNFLEAARGGLYSKMTWFNKKKYNTIDLIKEELLPLARKGLAHRKVNQADIDRYLGVLEVRLEEGVTGSQWYFDNWARLAKNGTKEEVITALVASTVKNQKLGHSISEWHPAEFSDIEAWHPTSLLVEEVMTTDLFTVRADDILELVSEMMDWRKLRYLPVEDDDGKLIGLVTARLMLRHLGKGGDPKESVVRDIMISNPLTIHPEASISAALDMMKKHGLGSLPVLKNEHLVGIITEQNFLSITSGLLSRLEEARLNEQEKKADA